MLSGDLVDAPAVELALAAVCPTLGEGKIKIYAGMLWEVCQKYSINTRARLAAFVAQLAHESGGFRYLEEIWGPTKQQLRYGVGKLAKALGNRGPEEGYIFRGRGWIQLTGRANYEKYGQRIGLDLVTNPALAAQPHVAFLIAAEFWTENKLNDLADKGMFKGITKSINGGYRGLVDRIAKYRVADKALEVHNGQSV